MKKKQSISPETIKPRMEKQITFRELHDKLHSLFPDAELFLGERYRWLAHNDDIALFLAQDQTNKQEYISDAKDISSYDCNVSANRLMGQFSIPDWCDITFGKAWLIVPAHALNCLINQDMEFYWVEPQTDEIQDIGSYSNVRSIEM